MMRAIDVTELVERIREIFPDGYEEMSFGCVKFAALLKRLYPRAQCFSNVDHIITKIDGVFYDITGIVTNTSDYAPVSDFSSIKKMPRGKELFL